MKITKKKEVVSESIEVQAGTYYFISDQIEYYKLEIEEPDEDGFTFYKREYVVNDYSDFSISVRSDTISNEEELPYKFVAFILGTAGRKIEKEEFEQQKQEVINKIANVNK